MIKGLLNVQNLLESQSETNSESASFTPNFDGTHTPNMETQTPTDFKKWEETIGEQSTTSRLMLPLSQSTPTNNTPHALQRTKDLKGLVSAVSCNPVSTLKTPVTKLPTTTPPHARTHATTLHIKIATKNMQEPLPTRAERHTAEHINQGGAYFAGEGRKGAKGERSAGAEGRAGDIPQADQGGADGVLLQA